MLVRVLGALRVESDAGAVIPVARPMERRLLAALALRKPDAVATDALIDALWPDHPPRSAQKTTQTNVVRLRALLGSRNVLTAAGGYRLADEVEVDADRFEGAIDAARSTGAADAWDAALAWFGGAPFEDLGSWPAADARRAHLEELHRSALESRLEALMHDGSDDSLVPQLEALVSEEPLREKRWCLLVQTLARSGRRAEALRAVERARRVLVEELGVGLGRELGALYESLLVEDGDQDQGPNPLVLADRRCAEGREAHDRGDVRAAVVAYSEAARLAREAGDPRRLAQAALGAAGDGWTTGLDATDETVSLLLDAMAMVPPGPTPVRSKLLARLAVAQSQHRSADDGERHAGAALEIARALDDDGLRAGALHALAVVVDDPTRHLDQRRWVAELLDIADRHPDEPWRRRAVPLVARLDAREGEVSRAVAALSQLGGDAERAGDLVAAYAAAHHAVLAASVAGDWAGARSAVGAVRAAGELALPDPSAARLQEMGLSGIIDLFEGKPVAGAPLTIEWPTPSMSWAVQAWYADGLARGGRLDDVAKMLSGIDPADLFDLDRDGYWLPTLALLADAAHLASSPPVADALSQLFEPVLDQTVVDGGCLYRGSVAHAAGLAAAACGRGAAAVRLLTAALATHRRQGSPWMAERSRTALDLVR